MSASARPSEPSPAEQSTESTKQRKFRLLFTEPPSGAPAPVLDPAVRIEEYKALVAERRFVMERYMHLLLLFPVIMGQAFKELIATTDPLAIRAYTIFILLVSAGYLYGAVHFKLMAYHAIDRERLLANSLRVQRPHPMIWGYYAGVVAFAGAMLLGVALFWFKSSTAPSASGGAAVSGTPTRSAR